ncbi:hypothetical protein F4778DRAFT_777281 [Xylariomycetidae sp. FL2044]|nr:hypothetical protein F4778DRAFT_777281 [Xylariomycetidae sp. FL2044]
MSENAKEESMKRAYVLSWESHEPLKTALDNGDELRASIEQSTAADQRVFVIHGLPTDYVEVLRDLLNIDPRFIQAHAERRTYRPLVPRNRGTDFVTYEYPELVEIPVIMQPEATYISDGGVCHDLLNTPTMHRISGGVDTAVFCRTTLWLNPRANGTYPLLFLDHPVWERRSIGYAKARYPRGTFSPVLGNGGDMDSAEEIPSFGTLLQERLSEDLTGDEKMTTILEDLALHQWHEFFEAVSIDLPVGDFGTTALYWQTLDALERNLTSSRSLQRRVPPGKIGSVPEWQGLLERVGRRMQLLSQLNPTITTIQVPSQDEPPPRSVSPAVGSEQNESPGGTDENKRGLDRVSYMGGVLLPLSIVSGILSMGDTFGPTGDMFFVFWAAAVPLTILTLFIIYADSIRKAEVWVEVKAKGSDASDQVDLEQGGGGGGAVPYSVTIPLPASEEPVPISAPPVDDDAVSDTPPPPPPAMRMEKMFPDRRRRGNDWRKEELGWMGACKLALGLNKLKEMQNPPPGWGAGAPRRARTN